jgi:hypothetical protein
MNNRRRETNTQTPNDRPTEESILIVRHVALSSRTSCPLAI